ncbi:unnamed protein product, partial [Eruca vesicaria subsp. sativa]|nr:unnamed protein product [Eruca vesicaria subsp. sativa]
MVLVGFNLPNSTCMVSSSTHEYKGFKWTNDATTVFLQQIILQKKNGSNYKNNLNNIQKAKILKNFNDQLGASLSWKHGKNHLDHLKMCYNMYHENPEVQQLHPNFFQFIPLLKV